MATPSTPAPARSIRTAWLLALVCCAVYNANLRAIDAGDTYPARYQPFGLLRHGTLALDPILPLVRQGRADAYWIQQGRGGRAVSLYPIVLPVLASPLYVPYALVLRGRGWPEDAVDRAARIMEKLVASALASASAALLYVLLRRRASERTAVALALVYAFGTTTWVISSQAFWQHGLAQLLIVCALLLVTGPVTGPRAVAAGALLSLTAANRPPDALLAAAIGLHALRWAERRRASWLVAGAAVPAALVLAYNLGLAGHWAGGYGLAGQRAHFRHGFVSGLAGLLVSPTHGLFVFSPFLLLVPLAFRRVVEDAPYRRLTLLLAGGMALQVLFYSKLDWTGGDSWGPRWLTDLVPVLFWMLPPAVASLKLAGRLVFAAGCAFGIAVEAVGAFFYLNATDAAIAAAPDRKRALWDFRNAPFVAELRHERARGDLFGRAGGRCGEGVVRGNLDFLDGRPADPSLPLRVPTGDDVRADGWALLGDRSPWQVAVAVDDRTVGTTGELFTRPDVVGAVGTTSPAGWTMPVRTAGLAPGEHRLRVLALGCPGGAPQLVAERRIVTAGSAPTAAPDLPASARQAAALLTSRQQPDGYWLTAYTNAPRFEQPAEEMNTFLTATLVDVLGPAAAGAGLGESVARGRAHLAAQIESDGLVRYHGRPDAPTIGRLGCAIAPDADDTALVWRIAPGPQAALRRGALGTLGAYRTPEGLYRTWLSPRERYGCVDPGRDPNPTDVAIQMHVLQLLAEADPPAARALCAALGRAVGEDRVWVYYAMTPVVPILRQSDLEAVGCPLALPASRARASVSGQETWVEAAQALRRATGRARAAPATAETHALLRALAADDFRAVRANPPLLYHNDRTASTPRYYWSEDFGYALWLRLFHESTRPRASGARP